MPGTNNGNAFRIYPKRMKILMTSVYSWSSSNRICRKGNQYKLQMLLRRAHSSSAQFELALCPSSPPAQSTRLVQNGGHPCRQRGRTAHTPSCTLVLGYKAGLVYYSFYVPQNAHTTGFRKVDIPCLNKTNFNLNWIWLKGFHFKWPWRSNSLALNRKDLR